MILKAKKRDIQDDLSGELIGKHIRLVDQGKNGENKFFYRIENPGQLAQIGRSYLEDYKKGIKNFAFSSTNYKQSQQRTILGVASYFDHLFDMKILIVTDQLRRGVLDELIRESDVVMAPSVPGTSPIQICRFYHHFDLVDIEKIISDFMQAKTDVKFTNYFQSFLNDYDLILWDTPIIDSQRKNSHVFLHSIPFIDSITFIVSPTVSRSKDLKTLEKYFGGYGINIKGIIFESV